MRTTNLSRHPLTPVASNNYLLCSYHTHTIPLLLPFPPPLCQPYCRFNARVLHRIGLFRTMLHYLLEASEPLPPPATNHIIPSASSTSTSTSPPPGATTPTTTPAPRPRSKKVAIAGFGGILRPAAAVAAAGLDTRDGFMVSCTLLLQRVLATCTIQRDFDRVVGATLSTLADGGAAAREARGAGSEPEFASAEAVLQRVGLLGDERSAGGGGDGGGGSAGDRVLSGQAMVRLYLLRMLLEIITLPVAAASNGELSSAEGVYVGGVGSPCAREAQSRADAALEGKQGGVTRGGARRGMQLERWVGGVPPVLDVAEEGSGLPSPLYIGRQRLFRTVCTRALRPDWFISLLETCREEVRGIFRHKK